ncbi:MAG: hypothetical protein AAB267_05295 [Candidatus Desantisbacteria bacterium]
MEMKNEITREREYKASLSVFEIKDSRRDKKRFCGLYFTESIFVA